MGLTHTMPVWTAATSPPNSSRVWSRLYLLEPPAYSARSSSPSRPLGTDVEAEMASGLNDSPDATSPTDEGYMVYSLTLADATSTTLFYTDLVGNCKLFTEADGEAH